jgi:pimeloyl-ACP methyl ester carboxylesterase
MFFPWSVQTPAARTLMKSKFTVPDPDIIQEDALDLLRTGVHEADGYGAAFRCDGAEILKDITTPCLVTAQPYDLLYEQLDRIPEDIPDSVSVERFDTMDALNAAAKQLLMDHAEGDAPAVTATATIMDQAWKSYADTAAGQLSIRRGHVGTGLPVVLIHNFGSSTSAWQPVVTALTGKRPFVALDLPGHGETGSAWGDGEVTIDACANALSEAMKNLGIEACHLFSYGGGGLVALKLLERGEKDIRSWTAVDFWLFDDEEKAKLKDRLAPILKPEPYGQHLNQAWYMIRDSELFWPWFDPKPENAVNQPPETDPARLHRRVCDLLKAAPVYRYTRDLWPPERQPTYGPLPPRCRIDAQGQGDHAIQRSRPPRCGCRRPFERQIRIRTSKEQQCPKAKLYPIRHTTHS